MIRALLKGLGITAALVAATALIALWISFIVYLELGLVITLALSLAPAIILLVVMFTHSFYEGGQR